MIQIVLARFLLGKTCLSYNHMPFKYMLSLASRAFEAYRARSFPLNPVTCAKRDLHSGVFGGSVHEAMTDLIQLMSRLVAVDGKILVPGIYHDVKAITDEERAAYSDLDFDCAEYAKVCHAHIFTHAHAQKYLPDRVPFFALSILELSFLNNVLSRCGI